MCLALASVSQLNTRSARRGYSPHSRVYPQKRCANIFSLALLVSHNTGQVENTFFFPQSSGTIYCVPKTNIKKHPKRKRKTPNLSIVHCIRHPAVFYFNLPAITGFLKPRHVFHVNPAVLAGRACLSSPIQACSCHEAVGERVQR